MSLHDGVARASRASRHGAARRGASWSVAGHCAPSGSLGPSCMTPSRDSSHESVTHNIMPCDRDAFLCCIITITAIVKVIMVPCRAVPCRAVPCRAVPCRAMPCNSVPCCAVLSCAVLCGAVLCSALLCSVLCCAALYLQPCTPCCARGRRL